jgi:hypothetical protein
VNSVIELGSELLLDESRIRNPYLRLWVAAVGERVVSMSPWVAVDKRVAARWLGPCPAAGSRQPGGAAPDWTFGRQPVTAIAHVAATPG